MPHGDHGSYQPSAKHLLIFLLGVCARERESRQIMKSMSFLYTTSAIFTVLFILYLYLLVIIYPICRPACIYKYNWWNILINYIFEIQYVYKHQIVLIYWITIFKYIYKIFIWVNGGGSETKNHLNFHDTFMALSL